jgi:hypothetical protein
MAYTTENKYQVLMRCQDRTLVLNNFVERYTRENPCIFARIKRTKELIPVEYLEFIPQGKNKGCKVTGTLNLSNDKRQRLLFKRWLEAGFKSAEDPEEKS